MIDPKIFEKKKTDQNIQYGQQQDPGSPYGASDPGGGPIAPVQPSNDPYSAKWLKGLPGLYAKGWGGQAGTEQAWYRTPEWAGGVAWNPYWGWQDRSKIKGLYGQGDVTDEQMMGWNLTRNPGEDWEQYYQQLTGLTPEEGKAKQAAHMAGQWGQGQGSQGQGGDMGGFDWNSLNAQQGEVPSYGTGQFDFSQIPMPQEWGEASDFFANMLQTGKPTSSADWYTQAKQQAGYDVENAIKQAAEQAGLSGMRWSTPLGATAQRIGAESAAGLGTQFAQQQMSALEAARARQMQVGVGLQGMGQYMTQYPMQLAGQAAGLGQQMYGMDQNAISQIFQQFSRMTPEQNPWLQSALGMASIPGQAQTYQPSWLTQLLSILSSIDYKKDIEEITGQDENKIYEEIKSTPLFTYRYKFEPGSSVKHLGMIAEVAPKEVVLMEKMVGLYEYIASLHATIKVLIKKIEALKNRQEN